jgi:thiosulfate dehydrogenase (quinone) large subunit
MTHNADAVADGRAGAGRSGSTLNGAVPGLALGLARIMIGWLWWSQLSWKMPPDFGCGPRGLASIGQANASGLCDWIGQELAYPLLPAYRDFLASLVVPNLAWMGYLIWATEAFIAVSLLLGLFTRLGGLVGLAMSLNLYIGLAAVPHEWDWSYKMLGLLCAIFMFTAAGRWIGLDALLQPRLERAARAGGPARLLRWLV